MDITFVSPDKTSVMIDDQGISTVLEYFKDPGFQPMLTEQHVTYVQIKSVDQNEAAPFWTETRI